MEPKTLTATTAKAQHEVPALLVELSEAVNLSHDIMDSLSLRLQPALRNEPAGDDGQKAEPVVSTDLGVNLVKTLTTVRTLNTRLADVRNRLEL